MTEPREDDETVNLHPGQRDEGGEGGMATREFAAQAKGEEQQGYELEDD
jgi:hypothetical protein